MVLNENENLNELIYSDYLLVNSYYNINDDNQIVEPDEISKFESNIVKRISRNVISQSENLNNTSTIVYTTDTTITQPSITQPSTESSNIKGSIITSSVPHVPTSSTLVTEQNHNTNVVETSPNTSNQSMILFFYFYLFNNNYFFILRLWYFSIGFLSDSNINTDFG